MKRRAGRGTRTTRSDSGARLEATGLGTYQGHMGPEKREKHVETNIIEDI